MVNTNKVNAVVSALNDKFENKVANKKTSCSGDYSSDNVSYPTVRAVKEFVASETSDFISTSATSGLVKNDGTIDTNTYLTEHQSLANYVQKSNTSGLIKNDGTIDTNTYLTEHQSLDGKTVTVEKQATAETGYSATYVVKQGGSQVGSKINIPKDFLVKSGSVKTCATANVPVQGYVVGDKYIDMVINSKDGSATDEHLYILVSDLVEDTTYTADNVTLQLTNTTFKVKDGGISTTQLASSVVTSLGYADTFNSAPCKNITSTQITNWDTMASGGVTLSDVDDEIDAYLDAIVTALGN